MSRNRAKRAKQQAHKSDQQKKLAREQELKALLASADDALRAQIAAILAEEELVEIRPEGLVTKGEDGKTHVHFWR
ncbi:MAG TPA: hypothetical protein ENN68_02465 [Methanomicrobia archaeon]|nr:hypothetical protein [Methanomicrobia archaeon]